MKAIILLIFLCSFNVKVKSQSSCGEITNSFVNERAKNETIRMFTKLHLRDKDYDSVYLNNQAYFEQIAKLQTLKLPVTVRKELLLKIQNLWQSHLEEIIGHEKYIIHFNDVEERKNKWQHKQDSLHLHHH